MKDWYFDVVTNRFKQKQGKIEISRNVVDDRIKKLDPQLTWYNTEYHVEGLLNAIVKEVVPG